MMRNRLVRGFLLLFLAFILACNRIFEEEETATKGKLLVCASESHLALIQREAEQFNSLYQQAKVTVFGAETRESIVYLFNDSVNIIVTDRKLNEEEQKVAQQAKLNLQELIVAKDALVVLVNHRNTIGSISQESLQEILLRKKTDWGQLEDSNLSGPIILALTGRNSGAYELLTNHFFKLEGEISPSKVFASQNEVLNYVAQQPLAIGLVSLACYKNPSLQPMTRDSTLAIQALAFTGVDSIGRKTVFKLHQGNVYLGRYPLHYPVYIYLNIKRSGLAAGFSSFIASAPGQKIILDWGLVPATMPVRIVTIT